MMRMTRFRTRAAAAVVAAVALTASTVAVAEASGSARGVNEFGMTKAYYEGSTYSFTYTKGYFCDTAVKAASTTKCEVGAASVHAPAKDHDPLYITVPLGFTPKTSEDCPSGLVCVDHPMTADLSRLEPALKALYPKDSAAQLTAALKNIAVPGHDHFISTGNGGKAEWWDVRVIAVTNPSTYASIIKHKSLAYITALLKAKDKNVLGPIPSNIWLYFGVSK